MVKYEYNGEDGREFPTVPITVNKGDQFEGPEGLIAFGLTVVSDYKSAPAVKDVPQEIKKTNTSSASSDISAGA
jgi:hypothetical protein